MAVTYSQVLLVSKQKSLGRFAFILSLLISFTTLGAFWR
jgi:hypothetical protein